MLFIDSALQLDIMENIVCSTGETDYDAIREALSLTLIEEFGKIDFDLEPIPVAQLNEFLDWVESDE